MADNSNSGSNSGNSIKHKVGDFMQSTSIVAKIAFLLLVIFLFVILLQFGISVLAWLYTLNDSPHLIDGMVDAKQTLVFPQAPSQNGAVTIQRSVNAEGGIEFTWSIWLFINDLGVADGKYHHIFHKGNDSTACNGLNFPNNAPGLYLSPNTNELTVIMNTYNVINEEVTIPNIPLNKWFNVMIRCHSKTLDVYVNGTVTKSIHLVGVPKQNYGDVYVAMNGGFNGYISNLWYFNHSLGTAEIQRIVKKGPNTSNSSSSTSSVMQKNPDYLSVRWYFYGNSDLYNP